MVAVRATPTVGEAWTVAVATVCFLGSMMFGWGPDWSYVPAVPRRRPGALGHAGHARRRNVGLDPPPRRLVYRGRHRQRAGYHAIGHLDPVTAIGGLVNASPLFFDRGSGRTTSGSSAERTFATSSSTIASRRACRSMGPTSSAGRDAQACTEASHPRRAQQVELGARRPADLRQRIDPHLRPGIAAPALADGFGARPDRRVDVEPAPTGWFWPRP